MASPFTTDVVDPIVEQAVLACILTKPDLVKQCDLPIEAFANPYYQRVYKACLDLHAEGSSPDLVLVSRLMSEREGGAVSEYARVGAIVDILPVMAKFTFYLDRLRQIAYDAACRHAYALAAEKASEGMATEAIDALRASLLAAARERFVLDDDSMEPEQCLENLREFYRRPADWTITTGWPLVDEAMGDLYPGSVVTVLARPGVGKSALGLNLTANWLGTCPSWGVLFASLEMEETLATNRLIQICEGWDRRQLAEAIKAGAVPAVYSAIAKGRLCMYSRSRQPLSSIEQRVDIWEKRHNRRIGAVVIDYFQYLAGAPGEKPYERASRLSRELKEFAKLKGVLIVNLCQVARGEEGGKGTNCPSLEGARDSGTIEENADVVIGLWRRKDDPSTIHLKVLKARSGPPGRTAELRFRGETMQLEESAPPILD